MLPLIQDKACQPAPSNVRVTEASKQYDYTAHTAKIKQQSIGEKMNKSWIYCYDAEYNLNQLSSSATFGFICGTPVK